MSKPQNQGWRSGGAPKGERKVARDWRRDSPGSGGSKFRWGRFLKVGGGLAAIGLLTWWLVLLWLRPDIQVTRIVVVGPERYDQLPVVYRASVAEDLAAAFSDDRARNIQRYEPVKRDKGQDDFHVPELEKGTTIFFVTAIARPDGSGVQLLSGPSQPDRVQATATLGALIEKVSRLPGDKLVLIDIAQLRSDWRMGLVACDFFSELQTAAAGVKRAVFLTSADVGERSWASASFGGRTAFLHFVTEGLRGAADGVAGADDRNGYVTAQELVRYVTSQTSDWVYRNRETVPGQHPRCLPDLGEITGQRDFVVARVAGEFKPSEAQSPSADIDRLTSAWKQREQLRAVGVRVPAVWSRLTERLMFSEEQQALGDSGASAKLLTEAESLLRDLQKYPQPAETFRNDEILRTNLAARWGQPKPPDLQAEYPVALPEQVLRRNLDWFNAQRRVAHKLTPLTTQQVATAVELQTLAEKTLADSRGVTGFVRGRLESADGVRRRSQDLLFTSRPEAAEAVRAEAVTAYEQAAAAAARAQAERQTLLEVVAALPWLARMVADTQGEESTQRDLFAFARDEQNRDLFFPTDDPTSNFYRASPSRIRARTNELDTKFGSDNVAAQVAALFIETRALRHRFAGPRDFSPEAEAGVLVSDRWQRLRKQLTDEAKQIAEQRQEQPTPKDWRRVVSLLQLPFLPAEVRSELLNKRAAFARSMAARVASGNTEPAGDARQRMLGQGEWQAFWMLQLLSLAEDGSVDQGNEPLPDAGRKNEWNNKHLNWVALHEAEDVYGPLVQLAQFGHEHFGRLRGQVNQDTRRSLEVHTLAARRRLLSRADFVSRFLPPCDTAQLRKDPAELMEELEFGELVTMFGDRVGRDFWRFPDADPGDTDWYRQVLAGCVAWLERGNTGDTEEFGQVQQALAEPRLILEPISEVRFRRTDRELPLEVRFTAKRVPSGDVALWLWKSGRGPTVRVRDNGQPVPIAASGAGRLVLELDAGSSDCLAGPMTAEVFYRGHVATTVVQVNPCSAPSGVLTWVPGPRTGAVAVQGKAQRSIVFVLDWSDSMQRGTDRWQTAVEKLSAVIGQLQDDDEVALVLFGHRVIYDGQYRVKENAAELYGVAAPAKNLGGLRSDYQTLAPLRSKREAMQLTDGERPQTLADWLKRLRERPEYQPFGSTPMFHALHSAADMLQGSGGAIVVITDGDASDTEAAAGIRQKLRRANIAATVILFDFQGNPESLSKLGITPLSAANDPAQLASAIEAGIPARDFEVARGTFVARALLGEAVEGLVPNRYEVRSGRSIVLTDGALIRGGERHLLKISNGAFQRVREYRRTDLAPVSGTPAPGDPKFLAHSRFEITSKGAFIDVVLDHDDDTRTVNWPAEVAFTLAPAGGKPVRNLQVEYRPDQPVPTWRLSTPDWPGANAMVDAFWKMARTPADRSLAWSSVADGRTRQLDEIPGRFPKLTVQGQGRAPKLTVTVRADGPVPEGSDPMAELRVQLGQTDPAGDFLAEEVGYVRRQWDDGRTIEFTFEWPREVPPGLLIGITSGAKLREDAVTLSPAARRVERRPTYTE